MAENLIQEKLAHKQNGKLEEKIKNERTQLNDCHVIIEICYQCNKKKKNT